MRLGVMGDDTGVGGRMRALANFGDLGVTTWYGYAEAGAFHKWGSGRVTPFAGAGIGFSW